MNSAANDQILKVYKQHPFSKAGILDRVRRTLGAHAPLSEGNFAVDTIEEITDQNHIGGSRSTLRLAVMAGVQATDRILDVGCGIGGSARLLASTFGCIVHGIDINAERIRDAIDLTRLVKLESSVTFSVGDALSVHIPSRFSIVWGQNSWLHLGHPRHILSIAATVISNNGRVAVEEVCLLRDPSSSTERRLLDSLLESWSCQIYSIDEWQSAILHSKLEVCQIAPEEELVVPYLAKLRDLANRRGSVWPASEAKGLRSGHELSVCGVIGYFRAVAARKNA